jgi:hypothetical protein
MKFAVGLPVSHAHDELFLEKVSEHRDKIAEVYFAWPGMPSGRAPMGHGEDPAAASGRVVWLLRECSQLGLKLDLLLNASCYGAESVSAGWRSIISGIFKELDANDLQVTIATTMSPFLARVLKSCGYPVKVRASINMRVGSIESMIALSPWFDSFYIQREHNRDLALVSRFAAWAADAGKDLAILANSGCLHGCPTQTFHDNLVAHEVELNSAAVPQLEDILLCRSHLRLPENHAALLQSTWIRPEDIHHYNGVVQLMKLATRMSSRPDLIINAYCQERYPCNLLDLLEPGFSTLVYPRIIDNSRFPEDWFEHTAQCDRLCHNCQWCLKVLTQVSVPCLNWAIN